jgi:acyl-coenzyme A synthetase/AMP-(fatty) acid ligase
MKMQPSSPPDLASRLAAHSSRTDLAISDADNRVAFRECLAGTCLRDASGDLSGKSILLATPDQMTTALALIELDGIAGRLVLCPADIDPRHFVAIAATAAIDIVVCGDDVSHVADLGLPIIRAGKTPAPTTRRQAPSRRTEWVLLTSGTTGAPKLVLHDLASLIAPIKRSANATDDTVWATFYDIRRYGGLQIFLRAMVGGASMILSSAGEAIEAHLGRLARGGVTHISGTPSHWRRVLMSGAADTMAPKYVRLSGEIADQGVLEALRVAYPGAAVSHAYASTEAGVGFNVIDGKAGFPAALVTGDDPAAEVGIKIEHGALCLRSARTAARYLGAAEAPIRAADGFVDTGDLVELRDDRYVFIGRRGGIINVGGQKVHPEEVEGIINRHPAVQMSLVRARRNPITGALVVADVVVKPSASQAKSGDDLARLADDILRDCRATLRAYQVPTRISFVPSLDVAATGKLVRPHE